MGRPVGDIVQVTIRSTSCGQTLLNVLSYEVTTASSLTSAALEQDALAAKLNSFGNLIPTFQAAISNETQIQDLSVQFIRSTRWARSVLEIDIPGGIAEPCPTANVAAVIVKRTEFSGRWAVGTFHLGGLPASAYDGGLLDAGQKTLVGNLAAAILSTVTVTSGGGVYRPVLLHPPSNHGGSSPLFGAEVQDQARVMRRRTVGLGI